MNLRADLILETEQRSASAFNLKAVIRMVSVIVPLCLAVVVTMFVVGWMTTGSKLKTMEGLWETTEPKKNAALQLRTDVDLNTDILRELEDWKKTRIAFHVQLVEAQKAVRPGIVIHRLTIDQAVRQMGEQVERAPKLSMTGIAYGDTAQSDVDSLKRYFQKRAATDPKIQKVDIAFFRKATEKDSGKADRSFHVDCEYEPRRFN